MSTIVRFDPTSARGGLTRPPNGRVRSAAERALAAVALAALSPALGVLALAIRITSRGPAVFAQERIGRNGQPFTMYKLRTMRWDADDEPHRAYVTALLTADAATVDEIAAEDGVFKIEADDRTTRIGRVLRSTGIDEIMQLVNVIRGEMALVGPRPALDYEVEHYRPEDLVRFDVLPGVTGLWQATARNTVDMQTMLAMDREYIERRSLALDIWIVAKTIESLARRTGGAR